MNRLPNLLTKKNIEIISLISEEKLSIRDIAYKLKCSPAKVHQAISLFKKENIVNSIKYKNSLLIIPDRRNPIYRKIKSLININDVVNSKHYKKLSKNSIIGIYGSYSEGNDDSGSDVDLIILTDEKEVDLREHIRGLEKELGKTISPLVIDEKRLKILEKTDYEFYIRLRFTTTELNGEIFG